MHGADYVRENASMAYDGLLLCVCYVLAYDGLLLCEGSEGCEGPVGRGKAAVQTCC